MYVYIYIYVCIYICLYMYFLYTYLLHLCNGLCIYGSICLLYGYPILDLDPTGDCARINSSKTIESRLEISYDMV